MRAIKVFAVIALFLALGSCKVIDEVTFKVTVVNNTTEQLTVFWNIDNGGFEEAGKVGPNGGTFEVKPVTIDTDNVIEVRDDDGNVLASGSYNQSDDTDRILEVN